VSLVPAQQQQQQQQEMISTSGSKLAYQSNTTASALDTAKDNLSLF